MTSPASYPPTTARTYISVGRDPAGRRPTGRGRRRRRRSARACPPTTTAHRRTARPSVGSTSTASVRRLAGVDVDRQRAHLALVATHDREQRRAGRRSSAPGRGTANACRSQSTSRRAPSRPMQPQRDVGVRGPGGGIADRGRLAGPDAPGRRSTTARPAPRRPARPAATDRPAPTRSRGSGPSPRRRRTPRDPSDTVAGVVAGERLARRCRRPRRPAAPGRRRRRRGARSGPVAGRSTRSPRRSRGPRRSRRRRHTAGPPAANATTRPASSAA